MPRESAARKMPASETSGVAQAPADEQSLIVELCAHLRAMRRPIIEEWVGRIVGAGVLSSLSMEEITAEASAVYDNTLSVLETGDEAQLQAYAQDLSDRTIPRGVTTAELLGLLLVLRDIAGLSLNHKYAQDQDYLTRVMRAYAAAANRILTVVATSFVDQRERTIKEQQQAIRELSTPVFSVWGQLLVLPIIGAVDSMRAKQLTQNLLLGIRTHRAKVAVVDITGVPSVDSKIASHILQAVEASRLLGCDVILTGVSETISHTMVHLGLDLSRINAVLDLQGGIEEGLRSLGLAIKPIAEKEATPGA